MTTAEASTRGWYSVREAAEKLGCSSATARRLAAAEDGLPAMRLHSRARWRLQAAAVDALAASLTGAAA